MRSEVEIDEFVENKRIWMKVEDISNDLFDQHYRPLVHNVNMKVLTTKQYVPNYLKEAVPCSGMYNCVLFFSLDFMFLSYS